MSPAGSAELAALSLTRRRRHRSPFLPRDYFRLADFGKLPIPQPLTEQQALRAGTQMPKLDQFLSIQQAAEYLGVCRNTLRNWCRQGKVPEYRHPINNYRLFRATDLDALLKETEQPANKVEIHQRPRRPR